MREESSSKMMTFWEHCDEINDCHLNILLTSESQELLELSNNLIPDLLLSHPGSILTSASTDSDGHLYSLFLNLLFHSLTNRVCCDLIKPAGQCFETMIQKNRQV